MYKVIVIDDEEIVRMGIRNLLDWEQEGFVICAEGKDGRDGLKKVLEYRPEVVLVDIKMPGLSGLELIRAARKEGFEGHFIILTGFAEFEFAKTAISLEVKEYLLKPIDEDELLDILRHVKSELQKKEGENAFHENNEEIAREELLRKILLKLETREELERQLKQYRMVYENPIFCAAILEDKEFKPGCENQRFLRKVKEFLQNQSGLCWEKVLMENGMVLIQKGLDYRSFAERLGRRNERVKEQFGEGFSIAVGHNVSSWYDLSHSYEFADFLQKHKFLFGGCRVLTVDSIQDWEHLGENPSVDYLCMLIEVGDLAGISKSVERFQQHCLKNMTGELDIKIQVMYNLMEIRAWAEKNYEYQYESDSLELMEQINRTEKLDELLDLYVQMLTNICMKVGVSGADTVIKRMYYYMEKNYYKDLKLENFGRMFNYNSNYLGKIFRREMGDSFNNILDTIRITNAKRLLEETDLKVYQISERVGYSNIDYFHLKFKKYVGISPKEYKKQYLEKAGE